MRNGDEAATTATSLFTHNSRRQANSSGSCDRYYFLVMQEGSSDGGHSSPYEGGHRASKGPGTASDLDDLSQIRRIRTLAELPKAEVISRTLPSTQFC